MASPAEPVHPLTPPAETSTQPTTQFQSQSQSQSQSSSEKKDTATRAEALLSEPLTSLSDDGSSKRPRDHRLIHLLLAAYGVSAYQERVPLQLMDFAYRYTSAVLGDALHLQNEGYDQAEGATTSKGRGKGQKNSEEGDISLNALRMSIQSRLGYQFAGSLPKEFLKNIADEKNRIALGPAVRETEKVGPLIGGVRLPHERHCLTGIGWGLKDEWESEGEESDDEEGVQQQATTNDGMQVDNDEEVEEDEEGAGRMEDVFGDEGGGLDDGDTEMQI